MYGRSNQTLDYRNRLQKKISGRHDLDLVIGFGGTTYFK
jgi:hypothetical protein